jgi:prevent-host-death family protein
MDSVSTADARGQLADVINRAAYGKERIVLTRRGKEVAAIVPIEDLRWIEELEDRLDVEAAREALAEVEVKGTVSWEEVKRKLGLE